ncbi:hypothetical protein IQ247_29215 [Plectonema cf. radiosum LEGE 06105]|uniref:Uncharacterized protein n=1 Tax=Plectonema cf. radiosum LEGE 06105 TaxID=945769 RepID=A0A8J7F8C9_9CYAN|nr:hypothetical protein [Plectonema radiosum]MBE9216693.1 hypothetical protein [Plectonema cf. radiosum LEGE 06105]
MKLLKKHLIFASRLSLSLLIFGAILITWQQKSISNPSSAHSRIPTVEWQNTRLPDWNQITFSKMPAITAGGSFQAPNNVTSELGYDPSRSWNVGQTPDSFTMLGDFQDSFKLQEFSLADISQIANSNLQETNLESFGVVKFQTLDSLVKAIPDLQKFPIVNIKPILDLLSQNLSQSFNINQTISNLLNESPHLGQLNFESLDLTSYNLDSIPGLSTTPIASFDQWQGVYIDEVPGLSDVPFSQFPNPANPVGMEVGIVDIAFATDEQKRNRTISGSNKEGFAVPCEQDCAHIELSGSPAIKGKAWISGKYQLVKGGKGILGSVNSGKEPTGRNLFGDAFKVAVWDVSEVDGKISQSLFFRVCMRNNFIDLGCTPYFIGPVPFMTYKEKEAIFLGQIDSNKNGISTPTGLKSSGFTFYNSPIINGEKENNLSNLMPVLKEDCKNVHSSGTNRDALNSALSNVENNYSFVGNYVCDNSLNCGRALGAMHFMSSSPEVRKIITSKPGGKEFLKKLDVGETVTSLEMTQYFSPQEQHSLMESETSNLLSIASQQTDSSIGKPFTGDRLVERASQMHFAGTNIPIDSQVSDLSKGISVKEYGKNTNYQYKQNLKSMDCL